MKGNNWKTLPLFLLIFLLSSLLLFFVALAHYWQVTLEEQTAFKNNEVSVVQQGKTAIEQQLTGVVSDLNYLSSYGSHYRTSNGQAYSLFDGGEHNKQLARLLNTFSKEKQSYDQIRFLDAQGAEIIRINNNTGVPYSVPPQELQKKSDRYYYQEITRLKKGELYISPLDLNIEKGEIERPFKPVLRFAKAVFNAQDQHKGSLLLNFMGDELLTAFYEATESNKDHIMLLNSDGYWLSNPNKTEEWGFMFGKKNRFDNQYTKAWEIIKNAPHGQFFSDNYLFSFTSVNPLPENLQTATTPRWKVVSLVPQSNPALGGAFDKYVSLYGSILLLLAFGAWILASTIVRHRQSELQVVFEQRFRQVLEHVELLAIALDRDGNITFCNEALSSLTGWKRDDLLGKNWFETCVPETHKKEAKQTMLDLSSGNLDSTHEDAIIKTRAGENRKIDWNHTLMRDSDGYVIGITCIGENVTDIRAQEKELQTLSRAVEQSPVVVLIVDIKGGIQYANPRFTDVTGYTFEEVQGKDPSILRFEPDSSIENEKYKDLWKTIESGNTWHGIFKNKKKNGEAYWASASISSLRDAEGKIVSYIGVQEDISERLVLEQKFRMSVEGSPYAMVMIDADGKIILINSRTEEYFGFSREELLDERIEILIPDRYKHSHVAKREDFIGETIATDEEPAHRDLGEGRNLLGKRKDGTTFPVEIALNLIDTDEGQITLASIIDTTQRHELESQLLQRKMEIEKTKTLTIVGRMASMVAHDLRNPLSSIKMGLQILSKPVKKGLEGRTDELKKIALDQVSYMEVILEDLLNYARPPALQLAWLDVNDLVNNTINMLQGLIQHHDVLIDLDIQKGLPTLYADQAKLKQIFSNLISNAIQAAAESGKRPKVRFSAMARFGDSTSKIQFEISDNGPGIDDEKVEQLFDPFYTSRAKGTGLGLAIVKGFVEQHHGSITLESKANGNGTICTLLLPISELMNIDDNTQGKANQ